MTNKDLLIRKQQFFTKLFFTYKTQKSVDEFAKTGNGVTNHPLKTISVQTYLNTTDQVENIFEHFRLLVKLDRYISPVDKTKIISKVIKRQEDFLKIYQDDNNHKIITNFLFTHTNITQQKLDEFIIYSINKKFYEFKPYIDEDLKIPAVSFIPNNRIAKIINEHINNLAELEDMYFSIWINLRYLMAMCIVLAEQKTLKQPQVILAFLNHVMTQIEFVSFSDTASEAAKQLKFLHKTLESIKTRNKIEDDMFNKLIKILKHMSEHYINESTIVQIFRSLTKQVISIQDLPKQEKIQLIDEHLKFLNTLTCKQLCMLKLLVDEIQVLMKVDKARHTAATMDIQLKDLVNQDLINNLGFLIKRSDIEDDKKTKKTFNYKKDSTYLMHDKTFVQLLLDNLTHVKIMIDATFNYHQKDHQCVCDKTTVINLFEDTVNEDLWSAFHFTLQGLNELFHDEKHQYEEFKRKAKLHPDAVPYNISRTCM